MHKNTRQGDPGKPRIPRTTEPKRRSPSLPGQMTLPVTRQQKFALLRNAKFHLPKEAKVRNFNRVHDLLEQIEVHTGAKGCRVRIAQLAEKMHCSRATVMRATKIAEQLGVLGVGRDGDNGNEYRRTGGIGPNWYKVFWDKVRDYCDRATKILAQQDQPTTAKTQIIESKEVDVRRVSSDRKGAAGVEWNRVRKELCEFGIVNSATAVDRAWGNGLSPPDCLALLAVAAERPAGFWDDPAAVLYHRLINARPGAAPDQDWPAASSKFLLREKREREREKIAQQAQEQRQQRERQQANKLSRADLEREFGPILDAMEQSERDSIAAEVLRGPLLSIYRNRGHRSGMVRQELIAGISRETTVQR